MSGGPLARSRALARQRVPAALVARARRQRQRRVRIQGLPTWCDANSVEAVATRVVGGPVSVYSFTNVSGYKRDSTALIWFRGSLGRGGSFVLKRRLRGEDFPAVQGFPGNVGPPEDVLYRAGSGPLSKYVPNVYEVLDLDNGETHYYLENLLQSHRAVVHPSDLVRLTALLLDLQLPLRQWLNNVPDSALTRYDGGFTSAFIAFAHDALDAYVAASDDPIAAKFLSEWTSISKVYLESDPGKALDAVHGDYSTANLFLHRRKEDACKVVDWEYAGWGWLHNDLASLLKVADPATTEAALDLVAACDPRFDPSDHRRLFHRCRLERYILDAVLVARQRLATSSRPTVSPDHFEHAYAAIAHLHASD